MAIVVPKYRVLLDDTDSVKDNLALALYKLVDPQSAVTWDLIPFGSPIRQLKYDVANRTISGREVVLENNFLTGDTDVDLTSGTRKRVTDGHSLYHPATKQTIRLNQVNTTSGVCTFFTVEQAPGGSRTQIDAGATLYILAQGELYEEINAESRYEETNFTSNYIQDTTELLEWSVADLRESRKWGVDKKMRLEERMRDLMRDFNLAMLYNKPVAASSGVPAATQGFDHAVETGGNVIDALQSGVADLADLRGVGKILQKNGVGPSDGLVMLSSIDTWHAYADQGLAEINLQDSPDGDYVLGKMLKGLNLPGLGFVPMYADPFINDDRVRFIATKHAYKSYYQGMEGPLESPRVIEEPSMSNSKVEKSTIQQKWGTVFMNTSTAHYILDNTGLND